LTTPAVTYSDLRGYLRALEDAGQLKRVSAPVSPALEVTDLCHRSLCAKGPALWFEHLEGHSMQMVGNLFGTRERIAMAIGRRARDLQKLGEELVRFRRPQVPSNLSEAIDSLPEIARLRDVNPRMIATPPCQEVICEGRAVDLATLPIQTCWPEDAGPLLTFGIVITRGPHQQRLNLGIYRQQVIGRDRLIMRWLPHRGGATDFRDWCQARPGEPFPAAVAIGADPATILAAVTPVPDTLSEYRFAGLLRGRPTEVAECLSHDLQVPARAEIVLEGFVLPDETAAEGPFGDHTGYYNAVEEFPVFQVTRITHRRDPLYHATYMGKPPEDEPSVLAEALNDVFVPLLREQFPEVLDFYLPPEACSYRTAVISIRKQYPGHARRIMMGLWSTLRQFSYTKFIIVTDGDIDVRDWQSVWWALSTRVDPVRDTVLIDNTPVDYLDFASPRSGLGSKMGIDATDKWPQESPRQWGRPITQSAAVRRRTEAIWAELMSPSGD
jgi:4-hydroxy-3-polyprenylbenzoate decarboxylase|tara:strand:- start:4852 stop:6342 length:1491 start_codon:yes stop_codon:yes gene_type:complete